MDHYFNWDIDFNAKDNLGNTGFIYACKTGNTGAVKAILVDSRNQVDFEVIEDSRRIPIEIANLLRHKGLSRLLKHRLDNRSMEPKAKKLRRK